MHRVFGKPLILSFILGHSRNHHPRVGYRTWFSVMGSPLDCTGHQTLQRVVGYDVRPTRDKESAERN
jgi:hypothetical protein